MMLSRKIILHNLVASTNCTIRLSNVAHNSLIAPAKHANIIQLCNKFQYIRKSIKPIIIDNLIFVHTIPNTDS